jgi:hypothetical protein
MQWFPVVGQNLIQSFQDATPADVAPTGAGRDGQTRVELVLVADGAVPADAIATLQVLSPLAIPSAAQNYYPQISLLAQSFAPWLVPHDVRATVLTLVPGAPFEAFVTIGLFMVPLPGPPGLNTYQFALDWVHTLTA